jgi:hypothetical protein
MEKSHLEHTERRLKFSEWLHRPRPGAVFVSHNPCADCRLRRAHWGLPADDPPRDSAPQKLLSLGGARKIYCCESLREKYASLGPDNALGGGRGGGGGDRARNAGGKKVGEGRQALVRDLRARARRRGARGVVSDRRFRKAATETVRKFGITRLNCAAK